ncbi:Uncharacterised protein, partial [Mycoplasma putrefaciens]
MIKINLENIGVDFDKIVDEAKIKKVHELIVNKQGKGSDFLGW